MKLERLKELLSQYPDNTDIFIADGNSAAIFDIDNDLFLLAGEKLNALALLSEGNENLDPIFEFFPDGKREKMDQRLVRIDHHMTQEERNLLSIIM